MHTNGIWQLCLALPRDVMRALLRKVFTIQYHAANHSFTMIFVCKAAMFFGLHE